jgi:2-polyprenyl-3-methyl-5-hydroxy-6-metoxy-1,4-benzoquinol methylase
VIKEDRGLSLKAVPDQACKRFRVWYAGSPARRHTTEHRANAVLDAIPVSLKKLRVLETGAGWGFFSFVGARRGAEMLATDLLVEDVAFGSKVAKLNGFGNSVRFCAADALRLPFADELFDVSISMEMVEHIKDGASKVCQEMGRVTRSNGFVVISTPNPWGIAQVTKNFLKKFARLQHRYDFLDYDEWFLTKKEVTGAAAAAGLEVAGFYHSGLTVPFLPAWLFKLNLVVEKAFSIFPFLLTTNIFVFRKK